MQENRKNKWLLTESPNYYIHEYDEEVSNIVNHASCHESTLYRTNIDLIKDIVQNEISIDNKQPLRVAQKLFKIFEFEEMEIDLNEKEYCEFMLDFLTQLEKEIKETKLNYQYNLKYCK